MARRATGSGWDGSTVDTRRHPAQYLALAIGAIYTLIGVIGWFVTGVSNFASPTDKTLLGFEINPLHNVVHLVVGLAGLLLWWTLRGARTYGWLLAIGYGAAFLYGLWAVNRTGHANFLSLNHPDNWLHLISALAGLAIALWPARRPATATAGTTGTARSY